MKLRGRRVGILLAALAFSLLISASVKAQYGQYGYGATSPSQSIMIEKKVAKPNTQTKGGNISQQDFIDNLSPSDPRFAPGSQITFRLAVKNTSDNNLTNVRVKDSLPNFLDPIQAPGSWDASSKTITFNAGDFKPQEEKVYFLTFKVASVDKMPADKAIFCEINRASAWTDKVSDEDTAQFCIEKQVLGVQNVPSAGPEYGLILLGFETAALGAGLYLKKRVK